MATSTRIFPAEPITPHTVSLSLVDAYAPKIWGTPIYYFPLKEQAAAEKVRRTVIEGHSRLLVEIPSLAGYGAKAADGDPRHLEIRIEEGASVEAHYQDFSHAHSNIMPTYAALAADRFNITHDQFLALSPPILQKPLAEGDPIYLFKLNMLKGGFVLCIGFNHLVGDASSVMVIEKTWAAHTRDISAGIPFRRHLPEVDHDGIRARLSTPNPKAAPFEIENWETFPAGMSQLNLKSSDEAQEAAKSNWDQMREAQQTKNPEDQHYVIWELTSKDLARLKKDASPGGSDWISTFDAIVSLFWTRISYIKQSSKNDEDLSLGWFPIMFRQRLEPPIDRNYIGNTMDVVFAEIPLSELEKPDDSNLKSVAKSFRTAVGGWSPSQFESWVKAASELSPEDALYANALALLATHNIAFNDYSKMDTNLLDWGSDVGCMDRARRFKPAVGFSNFATMVVVHPRLKDGSLEVVCTCTDQVRAALEKDVVFSRYCTLVSAPPKAKL